MTRVGGSGSAGIHARERGRSRRAGRERTRVNTAQQNACLASTNDDKTQSSPAVSHEHSSLGGELMKQCVLSLPRRV